MYYCNLVEKSITFKYLNFFSSIVKKILKNKNKVIKKMPKKKVEFDNGLNIRISDEQKTNWNNYLKEHKEFSSVSSFVRWCVDEIVEGTHNNRNQQESKDSLEVHVKELDDKIIKMMNEQKDILKLVAKSTQPLLNSNKALREYQQSIVLTLIEEKPRNEQELLKLMAPIEEYEILTFLNDLIEAGKIDNIDNKYQRVE